MSELKEKFKNEIESCTWNLLDKNLERSAVFLLSASEDIFDAAEAMATDNTDYIKNLLENNHLRKLSLDDTEEFSKSNFNFLIIQPYVLVQIKLKKD